jgi:hypothetical protein
VLEFPDKRRSGAEQENKNTAFKWASRLKSQPALFIRLPKSCASMWPAGGFADPWQPVRMKNHYPDTPANGSK